MVGYILFAFLALPSGFPAQIVPEPCPVCVGQLTSRYHFPPGSRLPPDQVGTYYPDGWDQDVNEPGGVVAVIFDRSGTVRRTIYCWPVGPVVAPDTICAFSATIEVFLFADGFESADFSAWSLAVGRR